MPIEFRAMTEADLSAAHRLWSETEGVEVAEGDGLADLAGYLRRNPGLSTVAVDGDRLIGAVLCGHDGRRGFVYHLAVATTHRGQRIGHAIMDRSLAALKREGLSRVLLLVAGDNAGGQLFWRKTGWEPMPFAQPMGRDL